MTNEFSKFRPRKCNYKLCAFCEKYKDVKPIFMKGFCENRVIRYFDKEYYLDGLKNKRMFLKRSHATELKYSELYIGSTVTVYARQLKLVDYGDVFTRQHFAQGK